MNLLLVEDHATDPRAELRAVHRAHRMISECNQALVRATSEAELLERVCRSIVEIGGYRLAWIGLREEAAPERLSVAAFAGGDLAFLNVAQTTCVGPGQESGPISSALRNGRPTVCCDFQTDPNACACRGRALERGYGSMIALPLMSGALPLGILAIYSAVSGAFNAGESKLLEELAGDISYGLTAQRTRLDREQALAALRESQKTLDESTARYRSLFTNMLNGVAYCRMIYENGQPRDFVYLEVNPAFERLTGLKDVIGKRVSQVIPGIQQTNPQLLEAYGRVALTGRPEQLETYVEPLGIWFCVSVYSTTAEHFIAVFNNITAWKHAEESLRASEMRARNRAEELEKLMDLAPLAIWVADDPGCHRITGNRAANAFYEAALGENVSAAPAVGEHDKTRRFFANGRELKPEELPMQEATARGVEIRDRELEVLSPSGKRLIILGNAIPLRDDAGQVRGCVGAFVDITERKQAEEALRLLNESLERRVQERTVQLTALNRESEAFAYSVSHDLRAPLRHIRGFTDILTSTAGSALNAQSRQYLKQVTDSAGHMGRLIDDLLVFSRMGRSGMKKTALGLHPLVEEALHQVQPDGKGREVHWNIGPLPAGHADHALLRQVFVNLLSNALKYTRPRAKAEIEIGCAEETPHEVVIFVRDNGVGFDMQHADKLFGVFQRLHLEEEFEGNGIGLANVRRIIDRHGGRTWAEGKVDGGATFYFSLPKNTV